MRAPLWIIATTFCLPFAAHAEDVTIAMNAVTTDGIGEKIGTVRLVDREGGLELVVNIEKGLTDGLHGFHVHEKASCEPAENDGRMAAAGGAGSHLDPAKSGKHLGPSGEGHEGDLPVISIVDGKAKDEVLWAPRLKVADLKGRALMIHAGGDNYKDTPKKLGGGGERTACGVFPG